MIEHGQLDDSLKSKLRNKILAGNLRPGQRIKESEIAENFHVSRTPVRQALIALVTEGLVKRIPNVGFSVAQMSIEEVSAIYPIVWTLEALALDDAFELLHANHERLKISNERFRKQAKTPILAHHADRDFHQGIVEYSTNTRIKEILSEEKQKIERYERFYMEDIHGVQKSAKQHDEIIQHIRCGKKDSAKKALIKNWRSGMGIIIEKMNAIAKSR
ncbi:GntR family transcriptional regulator [bacterium]|nr:GntR family transcriptional regulator [bacterium]